MYRLIHHCKKLGVDTVVMESEDILELRQEAKYMLDDYKVNIYDYKTLMVGHQWLLEEPEVCPECPLESGMLSISYIDEELDRDNNVECWRA